MCGLCVLKPVRSVVYQTCRVCGACAAWYEACGVCRVVTCRSVASEACEAEVAVLAVHQLPVRGNMSAGRKPTGAALSHTLFTFPLPVPCSFIVLTPSPSPFHTCSLSPHPSLPIVHRALHSPSRSPYSICRVAAEAASYPCRTTTTPVLSKPPDRAAMAVLGPTLVS